jgi:hypothetical protein
MLSILIRLEVNAAKPPLPPQRAFSNNKVLLLSSLNSMVPPKQDYLHNIVYYLTNIGYNVTYLTDGAVTINVLLNTMKQYSIVIWRTNTYTWAHTLYWYVGENINDGVQQTYASDLAQGWININAGPVGISQDFVTNHMGPNTLTGIQLLMFMSSYGNSIAPQLITAGVTSVIYCNNVISLQYGLIDDLTVQMVAYLSQGQNINTAVSNTISPFVQGSNPEDNLDTTYAPPFWYAGNDGLTIV